MDTTEQYIKMRLAAIPDLGMGKFPEAMGAEEFYSFQTTTIFIDGKGDWYYTTTDEVVQLERQDQLQEMVYPTPRWLHYLPVFYDFAYDKIKKRVFTSMEQLWLAFAMKEKHGKVWDNEAWING